MGGNFLVAARQISEVKYDYRSLFGYTAFHIRMTFAKQFNLSASIMRPQQFGGCLYSLRLNIKSVHPVAYFGKSCPFPQVASTAMSGPFLSADFLNASI